MLDDEKLKYPIGRFTPQENYSSDEIKKLIDTIELLPGKVEAVYKKATPQQLNTPYRPGGWTLRQVLHHIPDSHMNAYIRFKWTLTENTPLIKVYNEKAWAETYETASDPIVSIQFLKALHAKWVLLLRSLTAEDLKKEFTHPETKKNIPLSRLIATYAWHGEHHLAHLLLVVH
ncbi:MAG: putative metal-dependent hydrolase [Flammeovirgaceae bacterium]|nr:putative metal-dependent hydrolase [Flammeovirgaceae bacterium]